MGDILEEEEEEEERHKEDEEDQGNVSDDDQELSGNISMPDLPHKGLSLESCLHVWGSMITTKGKPQGQMSSERCEMKMLLLQSLL